jgi:acyl dehydratase
MDRIENRTFAELKIGDSASLTRQLTPNDITLFAVMSGDVNPAHVDPEFAKSDMFHKVIAHGMWGGALISTVLGTELPGPDTIYLGQTFRFRLPVALGDTVTVAVKVAKKEEGKHRVQLDCIVTNQKGEVVIDGSADVIAPTEKISRDRVELPDVEMHQKGRHYRRLLQPCHDLPPIRSTPLIRPRCWALSKLQKQIWSFRFWLVQKEKSVLRPSKPKSSWRHSRLFRPNIAMPPPQKLSSWRAIIKSKPL